MVKILFGNLFLPTEETCSVETCTCLSPGNYRNRISPASSSFDTASLEGLLLMRVMNLRLIDIQYILTDSGNIFCQRQSH